MNCWGEKNVPLLSQLQKAKRVSVSSMVRFYDRLALFFCLGSSHAWTPPAPVLLRTNFNPPGAVATGCVPSEGIALQWVNAHPAPPNDRNVLQTAFEAQVLASTTAIGVPLWSSGKVMGAAQSLVVQPPGSRNHRGSSTGALPAAATLCWRVRVWLTAATGAHVAQQSVWSKPLAFDTAPASSSWTNVSWVGGFNQLRAAFSVAPAATSPVKRARIYAAGMGAFYLWVNGARVADSVMDPPQSVYPSRTLFASFDVATLLRPGVQNVIGAQLGNYKWGYGTRILLLFFIYFAAR